jgi:glycosyltransferase involved in cell wall biosynthesis
MRIVVNTRLLISNKLDGIGWFTYETLKRICQSHPEDKFYFLFDRPFSNEFIFSENIEPIVIGPPTRHPVLWYYWFEWRLPGLLNKINPDVFISTDGYLSLKSKVKSLAVIHDLNFVHNPSDLPLTSHLYYNYFFKKFALKAERLATVSEYSKKDIVDCYGIEQDKIDVVYNGYNSVYQPLNILGQEEVRKKVSDGFDYFAFVGSLHPRKNVANMLLAFDRMRSKSNKRTKFLIIGQKFFKTKDIENAFNSMKYRDDVHFLGHLSPIQLKDILASAIALVLVSKFEGFGIPIIEALKCDTPVIVSNLTSLPEITGNAGLYADPFSIDSITDVMLQMLENEDKRIELVRNGRVVCERFGWDKTASRLWDCIVKTARVLAFLFIFKHFFPF